VSATGQGPVDAWTSQRPDDRRVDLSGASKAMDAETVAQFEQACRAPRERMARIAITPRWVR
jgi:hypothetical protein